MNEKFKLKDLFVITRGKVLPQNKIHETGKYPVYSSQTKNNGLLGYYDEFLYENAITWTTDGANAGDVNYREGKFYCTNVCGVLLEKKIKPTRYIALALSRITKNYVSYVGNPKLMNNVMEEIEIEIPPLEEQEKIGCFKGNLCLF